MKSNHRSSPKVIEKTINPTQSASSVLKIRERQAQKGSMMSSGQALSYITTQWWNLYDTPARKKSSMIQKFKPPLAINQNRESISEDHPLEQSNSLLNQKMNLSRLRVTASPKPAPLNLKKFPSHYKMMLTQWKKLKNK